ncbi:threonine ammonia-lyase [Cumulibacter manganitolerans]|uniref:threonine ammonia-lyase n=1 Tax=Cumulibacter manganitolerans TaxID=1884992 RepID=UPI001E55ABD4|nr:threonine ammonia-lyase [Cumulibacter manganitolerans]
MWTTGGKILGMSIPLVTVQDVELARREIAGVLRETPLESSRALAQRIGGPAYLKCENLQRAGSFKIRGAYVRIARLSEEERARGVVAASAGNHAQGVALAAAILGAPAAVYMPVNAPLPKLAATRGYGATVHQVGADLGEALLAAEEDARRTGAIFIHPFDHPDLIAGQGTCGLEILEQCPDVRTVVVSTGGGGLLSGVAAAIRGRRPDVRIVGVQARAAAAFPESLRQGHPVALQRMATMADGIAVPKPAEITLAHVQALVDDIVTVSEDDISEALLFCLERAKLVVEPAGAAAMAAVLAHPDRFEPPLVAILSGGNVDPVLLMQVIQHGMVAVGRYLSLRCAVADRPGTLARLVHLLADHGANIVDVEHSRLRSDLSLGEVAISLRVETKGREHAAALVAALEEAGYRVSCDV